MSNTEHIFKASIHWGSQGLPFTYKEYSRQYTVKSPGKPDFVATAAPEFFGSKYHYNPEDLLVVSVSACHMLTYLAYAANSKIQVAAYEDAAEGFLVQEGKIFKFREIVLNPKITVTGDVDLQKAKDLHEKAHHACFIANSVNFPIRVAGSFIKG